MLPHPHQVFLTGATGYLGRALATALVEHGHGVRALTRSASRGLLPPAVDVVVGDALHAASYSTDVPPADTFVHLVGTRNPDPAKVAQFHAVDLTSLNEAIAAAQTAEVRHFVYVSVAQPAPVMHAYVQARRAGEALIRQSGLNATILRPWYVIGPGRRWPAVLKPLYRLAAHVPSWREPAQRLGLVTLEQMTAALVHAVEHPQRGVYVFDVPSIRSPVPD